MYTDQDIANLVARVQQLEQQAASRPTAALPQYGIISKNFLTRAFSAWGLCFVSSLLIGIALSCIGVIIGLIMGATVLDWINQLLGSVPQL
ncbi:MAG TPA: hypothetical protein PLK74_08645 [Anaerolineaceae bacterium]|nr:hypothetical protein [Anaerolineaceae bacterium]HOQ69990.1 hypothetical protein [Anaerolineaceae bacterium]HPD63611.1 hypothetical protein [Anaerolineaceae bacterium]HQK05107.1 hypothetical protein [Anaerolineaceae bacterium]